MGQSVNTAVQQDGEEAVNWNTLGSGTSHQGIRKKGQQLAT